MRNKILRVCALALTAAVLGGSALPYALAESNDSVEEILTESEAVEGESEIAEEAEPEVIEESDVVEDEAFSEDVEEESSIELQTMDSEEPITEEITIDESMSDDVTTAEIAVQESVTEEVDAVNTQDATPMAANTLESICTYTISGNTMTLTGVKSADANIIVPKQYAISGTTYNVQINFSESENKIGSLSFESGYDLTQSLSTTKASAGGVTYYTLFKNCKNVDLSNVTFSGDMALDGWFYQCTDLQTVKFPAISVSSMKNTFEGDSALTSVNTENFNTTNCTKAIKTFYGCTSLTTLNVAGWNLSSMTGLDSTFANCTKLSSLDLSQWSSTQDVSFRKITDGDVALESLGFNNLRITGSFDIVGEGVKNLKFTNCQLNGSNSALFILSNNDNLETIELKSCSINGSSFGTIGKSLQSVVIDSCTFPTMTHFVMSHASKLMTVSVTNSNFPKCADISDAFSYDTELTSVNFTGSNFPVLTDASTMFYKCGKIQTLDLSFLGQSNVQKLQALCRECSALKSVTFGDEATLEDLTTLEQAFTNCESLESVNFGKAKFEKLTTLATTFANCAKLTSVSFGDDTTLPALTDMSNTFYGCETLTAINFGKATMSNVKTFYSAFRACDALSVLDVSNWDVSTCTDFQYMFQGCNALKVIDVSKWKFNDTAPIALGYMFSNCWSVNTLDVSGWNTRMFSDIRNMFYACISIRNLDVSKWDVSNVESMRSVFRFLELPYLDLSNWKLLSSVDTGLMFDDSYIKTLSTPDCSNVKDMRESLASVFEAGAAKNTNETFYNHYVLVDTNRNNKYHKVLDKTEVQYLKSDLPAGTVLSRICVNFYKDKAKTQLVNTEYPAYGTAVTSTGTWYSCATDEVVNLNSVTDSIDVYSTNANNQVNPDSNDNQGSENNPGSDNQQQINKEPASGGLANDTVSDDASGGNVTSGDAAGSNTANASTGDSTTGGDATGGDTANASSAGGEASVTSESGGLVQTGDNTNIMLYAIIIIAGVLLVGSQVVRRCRK